MQESTGLGLVIGLTKKSTNPEKKQVVFIRAFGLLANGSQSEAVKSGVMMLQDVIEAVNDVDIGTNLSVLTDEINKVEIGGPIKFRLSRRTKDEDCSSSASSPTSSVDTKSTDSVPVAAEWVKPLTAKICPAGHALVKGANVEQYKKLTIEQSGGIFPGAGCSYCNTVPLLYKLY